MDGWGTALETLPRLSSLAVNLTDNVWGDHEPDSGCMGDLARANMAAVMMPEIADAIGRCCHLTRLELCGALRLTARVAVACLREGFAGRLRHLIIGYGVLLPERKDAAPALQPLPSFTCLETLELRAQTGEYTVNGFTCRPCTERMEEELLALLAPLDALLPLCGALKRISITMDGTLDVPSTFARVCGRCRALSDAHPGKLITFENEPDD